MSSAEQTDVVVAGHICFDVIPEFPQGLGTELGQILIPGRLINVGRATTSTGGPVSNTGLALQRLGQTVAMMGKVGDDFFGKAILERLKSCGVESGMSIVTGEATSYTLVIAPPGVDRVFLHNPGTNDTFGPEDVNLRIVEKARLFHFGYPPLMKRMYENEGKELIEIFRKVKETSVTTSLDMSLPDPLSPSGQVNWDSILRGVLPYVDIFLPSAEETLFMLHRDKFLAKKRRAGWRDVLEFFDLSDFSEMGNRLLDYGATITGLKCGHLGFYVRTGDTMTLCPTGRAKPSDLHNWANRELFEPSFQVDHVASATGSGDSAIAGFLTAYLNGETIESCVTYACAVGAQNVQVLDAVSGILSWDETKRQLQSEWPKIALASDAPGWQFDAEGQLWRGPGDKSP